jgi:hypothetical protein
MERLVNVLVRLAGLEPATIIRGVASNSFLEEKLKTASPSAKNMQRNVKTVRINILSGFRIIFSRFAKGTMTLCRSLAFKTQDQMSSTE